MDCATINSMHEFRLSMGLTTGGRNHSSLLRASDPMERMFGCVFSGTCAPVKWWVSFWFFFNSARKPDTLKKDTHVLLP